MSLRPCLRNPLLQRTAFKPRSYAVQAPGNPTLEVFNRNTKRLQKERAGSNIEKSREADYLKDEVAARLSERLLVSCKLDLRHTAPDGQRQWLKFPFSFIGYQKTLFQCPRSRRKQLQYRTSSYRYPYYDSGNRRRRNQRRGNRWTDSEESIQNHMCRRVAISALPWWSPTV